MLVGVMIMSCKQDAITHLQQCNFKMFNKQFHKASQPVNAAWNNAHLVPVHVQLGQCGQCKQFIWKSGEEVVFNIHHHDESINIAERFIPFKYSRVDSPNTADGMER